MIVGALVLPDTMVGMIEAFSTRSFLMPLRESPVSITATGSARGVRIAEPIQADMAIGPPRRTMGPVTRLPSGSSRRTGVLAKISRLWRGPPTRARLSVPWPPKAAGRPVRTVLKPAGRFASSHPSEPMYPSIAPPAARFCAHLQRLSIDDAAAL